MERQEKDRMILTVEQNIELCDWMLARGLALGECACVLCEMECGDTFALALARVFKRRQQLAEKIHDKTNGPDWGNPIVP